MCTYKYENDFSVYQKLTEYYKSIILPFLKIVKWEDNILSVFTTKKKKVRCGHKETFGVFITSLMVMASRVEVYVQTHQIAYFYWVQ